MTAALLHYLRRTFGTNRLHQIDEVETYLQFNPFIKSGYRNSNRSYISCLKSILYLHNESINIWSHLLGFIIFFALTVREKVFFFFWSEEHLTLEDLFIVLLTLACYQATMICSSLFHTFSCHSKEVAERCLSLDLFGISLALLATFISGIHCAFQCHPFLRNIYIVTVTGIFVILATLLLMPRFSADEYATLRLVFFTLWAVYGFVPTVHWIWVQGGLSDDFVRAHATNIFIMYFLCGLGFAFYLSKFPECFLPGLVDYFGHSHNIWHVIIFVALLFWHQQGRDFVVNMKMRGCDNQFMDMPKTLAMGAKEL